MVEPLACVLRGLHETGVEIGDTVAVIGGGPIGLMFMQVAKLIGCNVIAVVKRMPRLRCQAAWEPRGSTAPRSVGNPVEAVRALSPGTARRRCSDRGRRASRSLGMGDRHGPQGRHRQLFRRLRQRNQGYTRYPAPALFRDHAEGDVPPHAGNCA